MRKIWGIAAVAAMSLGTVLAVAPAASAAPCGFYEVSEGHVTPWAYYNHCGPTTVMIEVDNKWPVADYDQCVKPGITSLKYNADTTIFAKYIGGANCRP